MILKNLFVQLSASALLLSGPAKAETVNVTTDVTADSTWYATNTYVLRTVVYVDNGATLTIEPGTVVKGGTNSATLIPRQDIPNLVSALWVTRGAKLMAVGTAQKPIIFTYEGDDVNDANDVPFNTSGQWGGVVLMGKATLNSAKDSAGNVATPIYDQFEGTTGPGTNNANLFGGTNDTDNSGTMRYVSIRYPGNTFAPNSELNGLTLAALGNGTDISYVEILNSSDDAFEWWGGVVNTHHLVAAFCEDDDFDTDQGYRGTNQFWFGIKPTWAGSSDSRGMETDGDLNQGASGEQPKSQWYVSNVTLIGRGQGDTGFGGGVGWNSRDEAAPNVVNALFSDFAVGIKIDVDGTNEFFTGQANLTSSVFNVGKATNDANAAYLITDAARRNVVLDPMLGGVAYTNDAAGLDPRPRTGSAALTGGATVPVGLVQVAYRGAFSGPADNWVDGWTALSKFGFLKAATVPAMAPTLSFSLNGSNAVVRFATQTGVTYQLLSKENIDTAWSNLGSPVGGTGAQVEVPTSFNAAGNLFIQVLVQ
jgi:hypothetical protein